MASQYDPLQVAGLVARTDTRTGCWLWPGARTRGGYAEARIGGKVRYLHRVVYEVHVGPIPPRLTLDHQCRIKHCINPAHLEPVTNRVNILRGQGPSAIAARRDACAKGHPYSADTYVHPDGSRRCRPCAREWGRRRR